MATKNLQYESGRSMVEILGTLAIIGVLSIGGIAGYKYGMDKYRANQTINDIMLMGVDMITQTSQKRGVPSLTEWGTKTSVGYDFEVVQNPNNDSQYGIQITGVPSRVCQMVGDGLQETVAVYVGNEDYSSSTETDPCDESDNNTMEFYFDTGIVESDGCKTDSDCGDGRYCDADTGFCFRGTAPEGTPGRCDTSNECCDEWHEPYSKHGDYCTLSDGTGGMCYYGTCLVKGCTYDENKCEGFGVYCGSPNDSCEGAFRNGKGTCVKADFSKLDVAGKTYYVSHHYMTWWDADAACKSLGKSLLSVEDLVSGWNGSTGEHTKTALLKALASELESYHYIWTSDDYSSCNAFYVSPYDGYVGDNKRTQGTLDYTFAVCK